MEPPVSTAEGTLQELVDALGGVPLSRILANLSWAQEAGFRLLLADLFAELEERDFVKPVVARL
jgi:hypothetical protein